MIRRPTRSRIAVGTSSTVVIVPSRSSRFSLRHARRLDFTRPEMRRIRVRSRSDRASSRVACNEVIAAANAGSSTRVRYSSYQVPKSAYPIEACVSGAVIAVILCLHSRRNGTPPTPPAARRSAIDDRVREVGGRRTCTGCRSKTGTTRSRRGVTASLC